jgi:AcrR family transcriptional regulator
MATRRKNATIRRRRSAEQARREILDAAEHRLRAAGPDSIRLMDVARDVGVSHPTILHHFGSREGLIEAVVRRAFDNLEAELVAELAADTGTERTAALLERVFRVLGDHGYARLLAWLVLSDRAPESPPAEHLSAIARVAHAHRVAQHGEAPFEDTLFSLLLAALAMFGDAVAGDVIRASGGLAGDADASRRFRLWLARLLVEHVETRSAV